MQYSVLGSDGNQYGPVDLPTLRQWATEGRVLPTSQVTDHLSNRSMVASQMSELAFAPGGQFGVAAPTSSYSQYPRYEGQPNEFQSAGHTHLWGIVIRLAIGFGLSLISSIGGIFVSSYALYYGIKAYTNKDPNAVACLAIAIVGWIGIGLWTLYKLNSGAYAR